MRTPQMQPTILNAKPTRNLQMSVFLASLPFHVANIRVECLTQMGINLLNIPQPEGMTSTYKMQPRLCARSEPKSSGATVLYNLNLNRRGPTKTPKGLPHWGEGARPAQVFPKKCLFLVQSQTQRTVWTSGVASKSNPKPKPKLSPSGQ